MASVTDLMMILQLKLPKFTTNVHI